MDSESRRIFADAVAGFLAGEIDNWAFDDAIHSAKTDDRLCIELRRKLWLFYCDVRRYHNKGKNALSAAAEAIVRRWKYLLNSTVEWSEIVPPSASHWWTRFYNSFIVPRLTPRGKFNKNPYWPFANLEEWKALVERTRKQPQMDEPFRQDY
jgi:hypothetical protein